jgi:transglutaminase-like putative cysteine protease
MASGRSERNQRCFVFQLSVNPRARIFGYADSYGNLVHHFDLPSRHGQLTIISDALVNIDAQPSVPELMDYEGWSDLEQLVEKKDYWDMLMPSHFARPSPELEELAKEIGATERDGRSPLAFLQDIAAGVHRSFNYVKKSTAVRSPIERALSVETGRMSGFCSCHDRTRSKCQNSVSLCQWIPLPQQRKCASLGGLRYACLGGGPSPRRWLGRFRSDD